MKTSFLAFVLLLNITIVLLCSGCDLLFPPIKVQFADTTITAPNGSVILYGLVLQSPLDSSTLARLRREGYTGGTDKAPVVGADVTIFTKDTSYRIRTDYLGRYAIVLNKGTYSFAVQHYTTFDSDTSTVNMNNNTQKDIILRPAREFVFPLVVGNKWEYDYRSNLRTGTETWEITSRDMLTNGYQYTVKRTGAGLQGTPPDDKQYSYTTFFTIEAPGVVIIPDNYVIPGLPDTIFPFIKSTSDTLIYSSMNSGLGRKKTYVNRIGLIEYSYVDRRDGISLSLRKYTLQP